MRSATAPELAVLAGMVYKVTPRIKVANGSGTMIDVTTWMERTTIDHDIDQPVAGAMVEFRRDNATTQSLAPLRTDSTLNRDDAAVYSPLLDIGRPITIEIATTDVATTPVAGDYKLLFTGNLDVVNWEHSPVSISARDPGGIIVDRWIEVERKYGSTDGIPVETVIQQVLDQSFGIGVIPLNVPVSPAFSISPGYTQKLMSEMDAIQKLAQLRGLDLRYKWDDASSSFKLTLSIPPRTKTTPDYTFGPSGYYDITSLFIDRTDIRNVIAGEYYDASTKSRRLVTVTDATSASKYGRLFFKMIEGDDSPINSAAEMTAMITTALADLKDPKAEQEIDLPFFWPIELNDLLRFTTNAIHYNTSQDYAVVSYTHEFSQNHYRTRAKVRGTPAGAYLSWLKPGTGVGQPATANALLDFKIIAETDTTVTYGWTLGGETTEVWLGAVQFTTPVPDDPWDIVVGLLAPVAGSTVITTMAPLPTGTVTQTFTKPPEGSVLYVQLEPRNEDLDPGMVQRLVINAAPTQAPLVELDDIETDTVGTQWWKYTERGLAVTVVQVQTQIGIEPISGWVTPTRGPGGASAVRGGTLGALEYEHDVGLDPTRQSWIMPRHTLENGQVQVLGPFGFDRDKNPNILSVALNTISATQFGTVLSVLADSDTKSIKITSGASAWTYWTDSVSAVVDVSKADAAAVAGLGSAATATYTITAYNLPQAYVDGFTLNESRNIQISGPTASAPGSVWDLVDCYSPGIGDTIATIGLDASAAPGGWNVKVYINVKIGSSGTPVTDHTADLSPALGAPPTTYTGYDYDVGIGFEASDTSGRLCTMTVKADLRDGSNIVQDTRTVTASWYTGP